MRLNQPEKLEEKDTGAFESLPIDPPSGSVLSFRQRLFPPESVSTPNRSKHHGIF